MEKKRWKIQKKYHIMYHHFMIMILNQMKKKIHSTLEPFLYYDNPFKLNNSISKNCNIKNSWQINYESTLRKNKIYKGVIICKQNEEWTNLV